MEQSKKISKSGFEIKYSTIVLSIPILVLLILVIYFSINYLLLYSLYIQLCSKDALGPFVNLKRKRKELYEDLESNWQDIRKESLDSLNNYSQIKGDLFFENTIIKDSKWKKIYLKWYSKSPNYAYKLFPKTMEIIDKHKCIHLAMFSLLEAGGKILPHRGPFKGCIRVHLCLYGPNDKSCYINVGGQKYVWKEGEIVAFDDTYKHYVNNNTKKDRIVLFLDVERRVAIPFINKWIIKNIAPKTTRINDELEKKMKR